jgi:hypothetical protein
MDFSIILTSVIEFLRLLLLVSVFSFILYKIFSPVREKLADKYDLSWIRSCLALNFIVIFVGILLFYLFFMYIGAVSAPIRDPDIEFQLTDEVVLVLIASLRILVISIILSISVLFFELLASLFMTKKGGSSKKRVTTGSIWLRQFIGIVIASAVFLLLLLFVFDWVPLGLFVFIFYGSIQPLPLIVLL